MSSLLVPVSVYEVLTEMFRRLDSVVLTTVAVLAYNVAWSCFCSDVNHDSFYGILFAFGVL